ncbi:hypothetical protein H1D32_13165 [Anaerobacillus sp. CMMVII]|uniref:hypothetical protein n=1 Tax=Anaerobacillus sp. CMMVII TaxID=2755588 RepID=UPI0021B7A910|nr:hypothetical protein [Anaerobacillus sp. CMMVII]MCT8138606.1 hypothetical protein [Anaerobacillus sp. CMMVII]
MWTKETLIEALEKHCVLTDQEKQSFRLLWKAKLKCVEVKGCYITPVNPPNIEVSFRYEPEFDWEKRNHSQSIISEFSMLANGISYWKGLCEEKGTDHQKDRLFMAQEMLLSFLKGLKFGGISIMVDNVKAEDMSLFE